MHNEKISESLTYKKKQPDIKTLVHAYETSDRDLEAYYEICRCSYEDRRNWWPGKTRDLRKGGSDAFPWQGASDLESYVIEERITRLVSMFMSALRRANIKANPVEIGDIPKSKVVSNFLKWMANSGYIPRFINEMELAANYMLERGIAINFVGWNREDRTYLQKLDLEQITQNHPAVGEALANGETRIIIQEMMNAFDVKEDVAQKAIDELVETGAAELPIVRRQVNCPEVKTLAPDGDFIFPPYVTDPQRAPYCFWRTYYTPQELQNKVVTDGWDQDFVDHVIDKFAGVDIQTSEREKESRNANSLGDDVYKAEELVEIIHGYQRLIDEDTNAEGIYETVFHQKFNGNEDVQGWAKFELMNGYEDYPVVVTRYSEDAKRLYDTPTVPEKLRGIQAQVKVERDSRMDSNSLATLPPLVHPVGRAPKDVGPGRFIPERRAGELRFMDGPNFNPGSVEMEQTLQEQADRLLGLDEESQISAIRRQFLIEKFLQHVAKVLALCFRNFQRFGPDSIFFQVTGNPDPQKFQKGDPDSNFDVIINFDSLNDDPEKQEAKLQQLVSLMSMDRNGKLNADAIIEVLANAIDPVLADAVLQTGQEAQDKIKKDVTDDLSKIHAGIELDARPNGAQMAIQIIQEYAQQPDIAQELQENEAFAKRLEKYASQYTFQLQQAQNAQIGKIGTQPASMGSMGTQGINNG